MFILVLVNFSFLVNLVYFQGNISTFIFNYYLFIYLFQLTEMFLIVFS